jgi:hypothetical protein
MDARRAAALSMMLAAGACAPIVGIQKLEVESVEADASISDAAVDGGNQPADTGDSGQPSKRVFVTSDLGNGNMGGAAGADGRCQAAAGRAGLGGTWTAWLSSDGVNAVDRLTSDGPYVLVDGRRVAIDKVQLVSGNLEVPINIMENGETAAGVLNVWTGTRSNGTLFADCNGWSTTNVIVFGTAGLVDRSKDGFWTDDRGIVQGAGWGCQTDMRLYCFER